MIYSALDAAAAGTFDIILYIIIGLVVIAGFAYAFITGKLTVRKIIKNPALIKETYDKILAALNKKINKTEKKEAKAIKKDEPEKADKYHEQRAELIEARNKMIEKQQPKLDNNDEI